MSKIVVFNEYNIINGAIEANISSGYNLVEPSTEMINALKNVNCEIDLLAFCHKYGIPTKGHGLSDEDLFIFLGVETSDKRFHLHEDILLVKSDNIDGIIIDLNEFRFCLALATALKKTATNRKLNDETIIMQAARDADISLGITPVNCEEDKATLYLQQRLEANLDPFVVKHQIKIEPKTNSLTPHMLALTPLSYAWVDLYNILSQTIRKLHQCDRCLEYFTSAHTDARFCGKRCGDAFMARERRERQKEADKNAK